MEALLNIKNKIEEKLTVLKSKILRDLEEKISKFILEIMK